MRKRASAVAVPASLALVLAGCAGWGGGVGGGGADTINVLMVNNPQMVDLQKLAPHFTRETGIKVNFTVLPENDLRDKASQEFSSQSGKYDVATLSNFEIPIYAKSGWVEPMDSHLASDPEFDQDDILEPMRTSLTVDKTVYGQPFYGESSFLMYRKDVLAKKGVRMPANPTWTQVASMAKQVDRAEPGMRGICLRGQPGWGQLFAPLTTVVNTFGGTWFEKDWTPKVDAPEFRSAVSFYTDLVRKHGPSGAPQAGFTECLNNLTQGRAAMWYDATSAAGSLEGTDSPVRGKIGYAPAPVMKTKNSGWLFTWAWAIQQASEKKSNAWKFVSWASSKKYEQLVGEELGWSRVPAGKRASTYSDDKYLESAGAFSAATKKAIEQSDPNSPGLQPRPAPGIQFLGIPEFPDLGTQVSQEISSVIAGKTSVGDALDLGQQLARDVAKPYKEREGQ